MIRQFVSWEFCLKCLGCCRFKDADSIWTPCLLDEELGILSNKRVALIPNQTQNNFVCGFLNIRDNICAIYSKRPFECQLYPFLINRKGKEVFLALDPGCPFIKENSSGRELKQYIDYLTEHMNNPLQLNRIRNNPQIIHTYEEAKNLFALNI